MNQITPDKRAALKRLLAAGASHRAIEATLRMSKPTIAKYARMWELRPICGCGKPCGHRGWCHVRLDYSPERRGWLAKRWGKRADSELTRTVDAATQKAKALGHDLGRFVWGSSSAVSMAFAVCRVCGKQVRIFGGDGQWERYREWQRFAGAAVSLRCRTKEQRAADEAARQEQRKWRKAKRTVSQIKKFLRQPSSLSEASELLRTSCE